MIRIAIVYTHYPHYREAVFRELRRSSSLRVRFFYDSTRTAGGIATGRAEATDVHIPTRTLGPLQFQWRFLSYALFSPEEVFVFLGNPYIVTTWIFALIVRLRGRRVLYWTHGWISSSEVGAKAKLRDLFYRTAHGLLLYGNRAREIGISRGFPSDRLFTIYNSLDYRRQRACRRPAAPDMKTANFLIVSRLISETRIDLAITALALLRRETEQRVRLTVVGDGPLRKALEEQAREADVDLDLNGAIYDETDIAEKMARCMAVISPGKVGLLAIHALAYGVPVITHDDLDQQMPEVEALSAGLTGEFFRRDDVGSLVAAMLRCLDAKRNETIFATAIAEVEARWTPETQVRLIEDAVERLEGAKR